ncbi:MAG: hypothetical protein ACI8UP_003714 [Porticoccaceae bacterium]|jgi:hypothetical protein
MNNPAVIARIRGGLGNQLFMYAMARRLAHVNNVELVLDGTTSFRGKNKYAREFMLDRFPITGRMATSAECREPLDSLRRTLRKRWDKNRPLSQRHYVVDPGGVDSDIHAMKVVRPTTFEGYWQSEKWFDDIADVIRAECTPETPTDDNNQASLSAIKTCTAVALHVRFFNDPTQTAQSQQVIDYYEKAVSTIREWVANPTFFIFSDQPEKAREILALDPAETYVVDHNAGDANAHLDLWLMSQCQHFITANSTFSWWGAWLGEKTDSIVVSPVFTVADAFLAWGLPGTIPERWISIDG